jgi:mannose-6-phosphate isomerase-like protein (cupin superfamily)
MIDAFEIRELIARQTAGGPKYLEFMRVPDLSMGLYKLQPGEPDLQKPHREDEVYVVVGGQAKIRVGDEDRDVQNGSIVYVAKGVPHRFHTVTSELRVLVFFAPAETSPST